MTKLAFAYELRSGEEFVAPNGCWTRVGKVETFNDTTKVTTKGGTVLTFNAYDSFQVS